MMGVIKTLRRRLRNMRRRRKERKGVHLVVNDEGRLVARPFGTTGKWDREPRIGCVEL